VKAVTAWILGTLEAIALFAWLSGGFPPPHGWRDMLSYPVGSPWLTFGLIWFLYTGNFILVFSAAWLYRKALRRDRPPRQTTPGR